ncbi:unnamed protein product [Linum trigynum]|uniref:Uncharacterized protein n=1 Tax=Linum trigynum TaxID=586398 RepID=A0AAV2E1X5_9ROSI
MRCESLPFAPTVETQSARSSGTPMVQIGGGKESMCEAEMTTSLWEGSSESRIPTGARRSTAPPTARKSEPESDIETPTSSQGSQWARPSPTAPLIAMNGDWAESRNLVRSRLVPRREIVVSPKRRSARREQRSSTVGEEAQRRDPLLAAEEDDGTKPPMP